MKRLETYIQEKLIINKNYRNPSKFNSEVTELYLVRFFPADLSYGINILVDIIDVNRIIVGLKTCKVTGSFYTEGASYKNCEFYIHNDILWRWSPHFITRLDILLHPDKKKEFLEIVRMGQEHKKISFEEALKIINVDYDFRKVADMLYEYDYELCTRQHEHEINKIIKRLER